MSIPDPTLPIEVLEPRDVPLGGLRAMNVRRTLPQRGRSLIGAWCFLDHYGPDDITTTGGMNVPAHPHTGLQTASWLFSGEIEHRDSAGFHAFVRPGELNLMTAGRGISHSERSTPTTKTLHGTQLWIALPDRARAATKTLEHYVPPVLQGTGWTAQVFLGSLLGHTSSVRTHTPLIGAEIRLQQGISLALDLEAWHEHGVLLDAGSVSLHSASGAAPRDTQLMPNQLAFVPLGINSLRLTAGKNGARLLFIGGEPFDENLVMWWNFVGRNHADIIQARADWQAELAAAGVSDVAAAARLREAAESDSVVATTNRFGLPNSEPDPPLAAPPAPIARLLPRQR